MATLRRKPHQISSQFTAGYDEIAQEELGAVLAQKLGLRDWDAKGTRPSTPIPNDQGHLRGVRKECSPFFSLHFEPPVAKRQVKYCGDDSRSCSALTRRTGPSSGAS